MVTIKDIADYANVSPTTVSNVIHGREGRVSAQTIDRVKAAIRELEYTPNMSARALVSRSSRVIAFINHVLTKDRSELMEDPFHSAAISLMESQLREHGYYLMLRTVKTPEELNDFLLNWNVDGMFLTGVFHDSFFDALSTSKTPTVLIDSYVTAPDVFNIGLQDFEGSKIATAHLIEKGHRTIGFAAPVLKEGGVLWQRYQGYLSALTENGITPDRALLFEYEMDTISSCYAAADAIASAKKTHGITAVVAAADQLAVGIVSGLHRHQIEVPKDLSIIGFDDLPISQLCIPPLTTIHQDMAEKTSHAVSCMLSLLEGQIPEQPNVVLPVSLVERESVKSC